MKTIAVQIPPAGKSVRLALRGKLCSGQAVIIASDEVEIQVEEAGITPNCPAQRSSRAEGPAVKAPAYDRDFVLKRLLKLKPARRASAVNSVKAMFQFTAPISDELANAIVEDLRRKGCVAIDANNRITFRHD